MSKIRTVCVMKSERRKMKINPMAESNMTIERFERTGFENVK